MFRLISPFLVFVLIFSTYSHNFAWADAADILGKGGKITTINVVSKIELLRKKVKSPPRGRRQCLKGLLGQQGIRPVTSFLRTTASQIDPDGGAFKVSLKARRKMKAFCNAQAKTRRKRTLKRQGRRKLKVLQNKTVKGLKNLPTPLVGGEESTIIPIFNGSDSLEIVVVDSAGAEVDPLEGTLVTICGLLSFNATRSSALCSETAAVSSRFLPALPQGSFRGGYTITFEQPGTTINRSFYQLPGQITFTQVEVIPGTFQTTDLEKDTTLRRWYTQPVTGEPKAVKVTYPAGTTFKTATGQPYSGSVDYYIQYLDSLSSNLPPMRALSQEGESGKLISLGMVRLNLRSPDGQVIKAEGGADGRKATLVIPFNAANSTLRGKNKELKDEFGFWTLNTKTGVWSQGNDKIGILADQPETAPVEVDEADGDSTIQLPPAEISEGVHNVDRFENNSDGGCIGIAVSCIDDFTVSGQVEGPAGVQPLPKLTIGGMTSYAYLNLIPGTATLNWSSPAGFSANVLINPMRRDMEMKRPATNPLTVEIADGANQECATFQFFCQPTAMPELPPIYIPGGDGDGDGDGSPPDQPATPDPGFDEPL